MNSTTPPARRPLTVGGVVLGEGRPKIIVPLTARTPGDLVDQGRAALEAAPDIVEWRVDHLLAAGADGPATVESGRALQAALAGTPLLATIRTSAEGGERELAPEQYLAYCRALLDAGVCDLLDVEIMHPLAGDVIGAAHGASVAVVASNHDFDATPAGAEIVRRLQLMADRGADVAKIAVMPRNPGDVLTLLEATWTARQRLDLPLITMSMAAAGVISRLGGGVFGSAATFAAVGTASAPGQVDVASLREVLAVVHPR